MSRKLKAGDILWEQCNKCIVLIVSGSQELEPEKAIRMAVNGGAYPPFIAGNEVDAFTSDDYLFNCTELFGELCATILKEKSSKK